MWLAFRIYTYYIKRLECVKQHHKIKQTFVRKIHIKQYIYMLAAINEIRH